MDDGTDLGVAHPTSPKVFIYIEVSTQAKISSFKNPHVKIDLLLLPRGQKNPLKTDFPAKTLSKLQTLNPLKTLNTLET
jgi:hypothetical protein